MENVVQQTDNYDMFSFIEANRDQSRGHVEALKHAYEEIGNLTKVQPILVNERYEIIDGQHRFTACKDLGEPIYYTQVPGLGVREARSMNILHRGWRVEDYAKSYALTGDTNYQKYIQLREDYGFNHSITLAYILNDPGSRSGFLKEFRQGEFVVPNEEEAVDRLEYLHAAAERAPIVAMRPAALALLKVLNMENFDRARMLDKLERNAHKMMRYEKIEDNLRQLEDIYNANVALSNRVRLY